MIGCSYNYDMRWQLVHLEKERADNPLNLTSLVNIAPLFANGVKLVKEQNTMALARVGKYLAEAGGCFTKIAPDQPFVPHYQERHHQVVGESIRDARLSVTRRADEQQSTSGCEAIGPKEFSALMLLDKFAALPYDIPGQN